MVLRCSQVCHSGSQHREADRQVACVAATGGRAERSKAAGKEPQPVAWVRAPRDPAVRRAGRAVVGVGRPVQRRIAEHPSRDAQNVRRCPRGVRASIRISGTPPDV
jgi:hypothetical protein